MYKYICISISKFRREASGHSGRSGVRAPFWPRKQSRVVRNRNSGSLGAPRAFGWSECACLALLGPPEMPLGLAAEPQMRAKVPLGPDPELPDAPICCSGLLRSRPCSQKGCSDVLQSYQSAQNACRNQYLNRISQKIRVESVWMQNAHRGAAGKGCSNVRFGNHWSHALLEITVRNHKSL